MRLTPKEKYGLERGLFSVVRDKLQPLRESILIIKANSLLRQDYLEKQQEQKPIKLYDEWLEEARQRLREYWEMDK